MSKRNLLLSLVAAALTAIFLPPTLQVKGISVFSNFPAYYIYIGYTLAAVVGMIIMNFIGKKIAILWQLAKFGLVGVLNTAIDFGILNYLSVLTGITSGIQIIPLKALSFTAALVNSYFWNKGWVFEGKKKSNIVAFVVVSTIGIFINVGTVVLITNYIPPVGNINSQLWLNIANVGATGISMVWNFVGYKLIVFKKK